MLTRRVAKAKYLLRNEGPGAVIREISNSFWLRLRLIAMAGKKNVELDGCIFNLSTLPDSLTKLFLLSGKYELPERSGVKRYLRRDLPVIELGGSLGVVACVTNKLLQNPTAHVVVEANPRAISELQMNKDANQCQFTIVHRALAYGVDRVTFSPTIDLASNSVDSNKTQLEGTEQSTTVDAVQLGTLVKQFGFDRFSLVCDIEGREYDLILNESDVLRKADAIILETHERIIGGQKYQEMMRALNNLGFTILERDGFVFTLKQSGEAASASNPVVH